MKIDDTLQDAMDAEPGLVLTAQGAHGKAGYFERDWGYRLRGAGLPGGSAGWLLTFAALGSGFAGNETGWLLAYEIVDNVKTGRVAVLRRNWESAVDDVELTRTRLNSELWADALRNVDGQGEADIDEIDAAIAGAVL